MVALTGITSVLGTLGSLADKFIEDPEKRQEFEAKLNEARSSIIVAEAQGESWMQRNWRPITMLTFVALIVARWLGFTVEGIDRELEMSLMDIIQLGLGGYIVGRSGEKIARYVAPTLSSGKPKYND